MKDKGNVYWIVLITLLVLMPVSGMIDTVLAKQETLSDSIKTGLKELPPEELGEQTNELLSGINNTIETLLRYDRKYEKASPEDQLVLQLQTYRLRKLVIEQIHQLADVLVDLEKEGKQDKLRQEVEGVFSKIVPHLWYHINQLGNEIDALRAERTKADSGQLMAIETKIARYTQRLDTYFKLSLAHIEKMKSIGMDAKKDKAEASEFLAQRADDLSSRIDLALIRIEDFNSQLKEKPEDAALVNGLKATKKDLTTNTDSMQTMLGLMDTLDQDTKAYRTKLVTTTRDISSTLTDATVTVSLASRMMKRLKNWLFESGPKYLFKLLFFIGILFVFYMLARVVRAGLVKVLGATNINLSELARRMLISWVFNLVILLGILIALSQLGISLGPLLAGLGIAGFVIGFALQDTLGNFASGIMILLYRPYDVGDLIDVGGVFGKVNKMNLVSTSLLTVDNQLFIMPNSKIWGDVIKNVTARNTRRIDMVFGISYKDDIPKAESILEDILKQNEKVLDTPEPVVRLHTLGASSVDFIVRPWVKVEDYWDVYWDVTRTVKLRFDEEGVSIPFPQTDVHLYHEDHPAPAS